MGRGPGKNNIPVAMRLWRRVERLPWSGCWIWMGATDSHGYGQINVGGAGTGVLVGTHRLALELTVGPLPPGVRALHHCDVPPCINPAHLYAGTQADNIADKMRRGRHVAISGERHYLAKLSDATVLEIVDLLPVLSDAELASIYGCDPTTIHGYRIGRNRRKTLHQHVKETAL